MKPSPHADLLAAIAALPDDSATGRELQAELNRRLLTDRWCRRHVLLRRIARRHPR